MPTLEQTLVVVAKQRLTDEVVRVSLVAPDRERLADWTPGSHIGLYLPMGRRAYSLCGDRWDAHKYDVAVLREPNGQGGSAYVHDVLAVGDNVTSSAPCNFFPMVPARRYVFFAGGIGITPFLPMIAQACRTGADWRLVYGGRSRASMAFLPELRQHGAQVVAVPEDEVGLPDVRAVLVEEPDDACVYCCGPPGLVDAVRASIPGDGHRLRTERFAGSTALRPTDKSFRVTLARAGRRIDVPADRSLLDVLVEAGVDVRGSCGEGTCGSCETTVLAGDSDHRDLIFDAEEHRTESVIFPCVSRARGDGLVLDM